jgi:hypothetical protein
MIKAKNQRARSKETKELSLNVIYVWNNKINVKFNSLISNSSFLHNPIKTSNPFNHSPIPSNSSPLSHFQQTPNTFLRCCFTSKNLRVIQNRARDLINERQIFDVELKSFPRQMNKLITNNQQKLTQSVRNTNLLR